MIKKDEKKEGKVSIAKQDAIDEKLIHIFVFILLPILFAICIIIVPGCCSVKQGAQRKRRRRQRPTDY